MFHIDLEREAEDRWIGEVSALPGVLAYGVTSDEARMNAALLALRVVSERIEHGEALPPEAHDLFTVA
jgi:predicted RNase H-like HicB family nuclease